MIWRVNLTKFIHKNYSDQPVNRGMMHRVSDFDRRVLVWTGKFKSKHEVPDEVGMRVMDKARNKMRIKVSNYMMLGTLAGCLLMVYLGKQAKGRGENLGKMTEDWHKELRKEASDTPKQ